MCLSRKCWKAAAATFCDGVVRARPTGEHEDRDGMAIEPFELHDNLMRASGVTASGGCIVAGTVPTPTVIRRSWLSNALSSVPQRCCHGRLANSGGGITAQFAKASMFRDTR